MQGHKVVKFSDHRMWGQLSYLDYLEQNNVQFDYDGSTLSFSSEEAQQKASSIWHCLTGQHRIGVVG